MYNNSQKLGFGLYLFTSFLLGFFLSKNLYTEVKLNEGEKGIEKVLNNTNTEDLDLSNFWEAYDHVKKTYYAFDGIKKETIVNGMVKGMIDSLGDKHTEFMSINEKKEFESMLAGDFEGIGAVVELNEMGVRVERLIAGSPAIKSGILTGDIIVKANGEELKGLSLYEAVGKIKGPAGSKVTLTLIREGASDFIEKEVVREKIKVPSVELEFLEDNTVGYIKLNMFGDTTSQEFNKTLDEVKEKKVEGIIIDLRDNGGGYLQSAVQILSNFVEKNKTLVETRYRNAYLNQSYYSINKGDTFDKKIVILINANSASASEITAGALRDYGKAVIIGEKSYGKGSVQEPFNMSNGSLLKLTIARWYTPNGTSIEEKGIAPDIEVKLDLADHEKKYDRQKEEAIKVLKSFIKNGSLQITIDAYNKELEGQKK